MLKADEFFDQPPRRLPSEKADVMVYLLAVGLWNDFSTWRNRRQDWNGAPCKACGHRAADGRPIRPCPSCKCCVCALAAGLEDIEDDRFYRVRLKRLMGIWLRCRKPATR